MNDNNAWGAIQACINLKIDPAQTIEIAAEIGKLNSALIAEARRLGFADVQLFSNGLMFAYRDLVDVSELPPRSFSD